jgi:hypothetical protein
MKLENIKEGVRINILISNYKDIIVCSNFLESEVYNEIEKTYNTEFEKYSETAQENIIDAILNRKVREHKKKIFKEQSLEKDF